MGMQRYSITGSEGESVRKFILLVYLESIDSNTARFHFLISIHNINLGLSIHSITMEY
jgi:hypothetical protein